MRFFAGEACPEKAHKTGTHRSRSPAATFAAYAPLMPKLGITRLANVTGLDVVGIPVFMAVRPNARSLAVAQGKGIDAMSAKVSALMESIEVWHAENLVMPMRRETFTSLRASSAVLDIHPLPVVGEGLLDPRRPLEWIEGRDLLRGGSVWVPRDAVDLGRPEPEDGSPILACDSSGLASGNHLVEATTHALCELIERDAATLWFLGTEDPTGKATQIDLATVDDPECRALLARLHAAGLIVGAYDVTSDVGIPVCQVVVLDPPESPRPLGYFWGFGCHLSPAVALSRALTEAAQCRLAEIAGSREDIDPEAYQQNRDPEELREMRDLIATPAPTRPFGARTSRAPNGRVPGLEALCDEHYTPGPRALEAAE
jgi:ribosomal protein S12 methylthiotransferase accessory factor